MAEKYEVTVGRKTYQVSLTDAGDPVRVWVFSRNTNWWSEIWSAIKNNNNNRRGLKTTAAIAAAQQMRRERMDKFARRGGLKDD